MKKNRVLAAVFTLFMAHSAAFSQSEEVPKFEVAAEFSTFEREGFFPTRRTEPGIGGRFTYNLNRIFSIETAGYFFPKDCGFSCQNPGRMAEVVGGVKVGKRFDRWGIFAKARPGIVHFTSEFGGFVTCLSLTCPIQIEPFHETRTHFAMDLGGVVEFYPSKRIVTRFDVGDTIVRFNRQTADGLVFNPMTNRFDPFLFVLPERTRHHFQFVTSVGFRF